MLRVNWKRRCCAFFWSIDMLSLKESRFISSFQLLARCTSSAFAETRAIDLLEIRPLMKLYA